MASASRGPCGRWPPIISVPARTAVAVNTMPFSRRRRRPPGRRLRATAAMARIFSQGGSDRLDNIASARKPVLLNWIGRHPPPEEARADMEASQLRERLTRWIEESRELFAQLPELFETEQKKLNAKTDHVEKEADKLRKELAELRKELAEAKTHDVT